MNHCPMLEEIGEPPSSLTGMKAHSCPCLETETFSSPLWSSLLKTLQISNSGTGDLSFQEVVEYQSGDNSTATTVVAHQIQQFGVTYFPQIKIPREYRSSRWNNFKAHFHTEIGYGSFTCGDNTCFKVKSCGYISCTPKIRCIALSRQEKPW
ncbi:hypothetical protein CK203_038313 [Vitis vinifera]|uniref:Uncharacterized protein n=1 Tax=Vitis vinifera TaxID=29760 RepID=A0A438HEN5_VITVI|nr:hypothetical protein CK203_038313 [Vitis vinifera]